MNVLVMGAGTVGRWIARKLHTDHNVTIMDLDPRRKDLVEDQDVKFIAGSASQASTLFQIGASQMDLCVAVTSHDETNLIAASVAKKMGARRAIARVQAPEYHNPSTFDYVRHFGIDRLLSLEQLSALELARGIIEPSLKTVENFAQGALEVQELVIDDRAQCVGSAIRDLRLKQDILVGSIGRGGKTRIASADDRLAVGDSITLIGKPEEIDQVRGHFQKRSETRLNIFIAGGGDTAYHLARLLSDRRFNLVIIEADPQRCQRLGQLLSHITVVNRDGTRQLHLKEERVGSADVFIACTGDDENNIMACVEARDLGAKNIMAIVGRPDYAELMGRLGIDLAVSPRTVMARQIMGYVTAPPLFSRMQLTDHGLCVLELEIYEQSPAAGKILSELSLPNECLIAARMRDAYTSVPNGQSRLQAEDRILVLTAPETEELVLDVFRAS